MLTTIIIAVITIILSYIYFRDIETDTKELKMKSRVFGSVFLGCFVFILISMVSCAFSYNNYYDYENSENGVEIQSDEILNFQDVQQSESQYSFLIAYASGSSKDIMYYSYYVKTEYGYKYQKISPEEEQVYIKYCDEGEIPRVETELDKYKREKILTKKPNIWTTNIFSYFKYHKYNIGDIISTDEWTANKLYERTVFYIPEGSLSVQYDVDMQ